jgi:hypothetical protein
VLKTGGALISLCPWLRRRGFYLLYGGAGDGTPEDLKTSKLEVRPKTSKKEVRPKNNKKISKKEVHQNTLKKCKIDTFFYLQTSVHMVSLYLPPLPCNPRLKHRRVRKRASSI